MRRTPWLIAILWTALAAPLPAQAPSNAPDLLALVPSEFGFCLIVNDLRGHWQRLERTPWAQALKQSPLGQAVLSAPEFRDLAKFERDLKLHLDVDWPTVRDDVLGDAVVFAFRPANAAHQDEQGLILVKARQTDTMVRLIDRLNEVQTKAGELKALESRHHQKLTYYRRAHGKTAHWYSIHGPVLAIASSEAVIKAVLERQAEAATGRAGEAAPIRQALRRAGADQALAALWLNPRRFDAELADKAKNRLGPEGHVLSAFLAHWRTLDAVVVALDVKEDVEARLALLARPGDRSPVAKAWFARRGQASDFWQRVPANAILVVAGQTDFAALAKGLLDLAPETVRDTLVEAARKNVGAALGLDPLGQVLPNLGPDWGVCVLPAQAGKQFPQALVALAVKPGDKDPAVDQALFKALQFFVGLALFEHNRTHADAIRMLTAPQGSVDVKYLSQDRLFPAGLQPAAALKDGYLLVATSPNAIEQFQRPASAAAAADEVPLVRLSPVELGQLVRLHRERVVEHMMQQNGQSKAAAGQALDALLAIFDLCRSITLSERADADVGRVVWKLRLQLANGMGR